MAGLTFDLQLSVNMSDVDSTYSLSSTSSPGSGWNGSSGSWELITPRELKRLAKNSAVKTTK